ncbi:MAG: sensor domain-containing diguanylate cyclase [Gammaproteobacteria bacterium]|nr:MAG: sensor domain-containing diguanylate cyclase [Gammaproteobacteria bacterium]
MARQSVTPFPTSAATKGMQRVDELEAENQALRQLLHKLTSDAAYNESVMQRFQERELGLLSAQDLPDLIERLTSGLRTSFGLESVRLVLLDPYGVIEELLAALGVQSCHIPHLYLERDVRRTLDRYPDLHRPWLGPWVRRHQPFPSPQTPVRSEALLPLRQPDGIAGFLHLGSADPHRFHPDQGTEFLDRLGRLAAVCLENAVNRERLRLAGLTDGLTGLYNRRHLDTRLAEEVARARRHRLALSCLFIDADHFKQINDRFGHAAGDQVLIALAKRIRDQLRTSDLAARYGGEEIAVLLPQTDLDNATRLAERIREAVIASPVETTDGAVIPLTVSIGVATLAGLEKGTLDEQARELLEAADRQVYRAQESRRIRVCAMPVSA